MKINLKLLENICDLSTRKLMNTLSETYDWDTQGLYFWKDCGSKVLAVAHLDTVGGHVPFNQLQTSKDVIAMSMNLDDRLGVYTILDLLPQFGINVDILFTDNEECCDSTAQFFVETHPKEYNWIIEFDRAGEDIVLYSYGRTPKLSEDLQIAGFKIGKGSYSDICELYPLKTGAFNMGIGYHFQHTEQCIAIFSELSRQLVKLKMFYHMNYDKKYVFPYNEGEERFSYLKYRTWAFPQGWDYFSDETEEETLQRLYGGKRKMDFETLRLVEDKKNIKSKKKILKNKKKEAM